MVSSQRSFASLFILALELFFIPAESLHLVNLTGLANCDNLERPLAYFTEWRQEVNPDTGICAVIHAKYNWTKVATDTKVMKMTFYKCAKDSTGPCLDNLSYHEEIVDCNRLLTDSSGPWHMYTSSMSGSKCGEHVGAFDMDYTTLKIDHLVKYLDIDDEKYRRFRMRTLMASAESQQVIACTDVDFELLKVIT